tara:strand:+ start:151 stop:948 length:798 start_codon:yes stop_codon:yes gene_type:complete
MGFWTSSWFEINGRGTYIEGVEREPSIVVEYTIDSSQESISVSLENATPLLQYWRNRETISNQEMTGENQQENNTRNPSTKEASSALDVIRTLIGIVIFFIGFSLVQSVRKLSQIWNKVSIVAWFILGLFILIQVPMSAISDFGLSQDGESSTGGFDSASNDEVSVDQFAHHYSNSGIGLEFFSLNFDYISQGYDLGLLTEEDRQQVINNPPQVGEEGYESFIKFDAEMKAGPGPVIYWWIGMGVLFFYWNRSLKTDSNNGNLDF